MESDLGTNPSVLLSLLIVEACLIKPSPVQQYWLCWLHQMHQWRGNGFHQTAPVRLDPLEADRGLSISIWSFALLICRLVV